MKPLYQHTFTNRGTSAVEAVVYVAIFSLIMLALLNFAYYSFKKQSYSTAVYDASFSARKALSELLSDIRSASYSDNGAYPIERFEGYEFIFYSDTDKDGKIEKIRYFLDGTTLKKQIFKSSGIPPIYLNTPDKESAVASYVQNQRFSETLFEYLDKYGNKITNPNDLLKIVTVNIKIITDKNPNRAPDKYNFEASASIRNLIEDYAK